MKSLRVGVVFGGQSVEHEVSVITAHEVMAVLALRHTVVPLYISKAGAWYTGSQLLSLDGFRDVTTLLQSAVAVTPSVDASRPGSLLMREAKRGLFNRQGEDIAVDVVLPLVHGSHGEDGTLAGLCELWGVAYAGCGVAAAALSMDKPLSKQVFRGAGLPVLEDFVIRRDQWTADRAAVAAAVETALPYPLFVKPAHLGSSIGVAPARSRSDLLDAIDAAVFFDDAVLIEPLQEEMIEINCAVLGRGTALRASVCEQPVTAGTLSYQEKYVSGGKGGSKGGGAKGAGMASAQRLIPAPISEELTARIQEIAMAGFRALGAAGVARVDFLVRPDSNTVILNEINTIPGALSFYLWEPAGIGFGDLLDTLLELALAAQADRQATTFSINSWLLDAATGGSKTSN